MLVVVLLLLLVLLNLLVVVAVLLQLDPLQWYKGELERATALSNTRGAVNAT